MDKKQAQALIKETFELPFDKNRFVGFVKNLLNNVEEATFIYKGNYIPDAYEQYINTLERIGKYTDGEHKIDILIAKLKKETSIERARTMQRNFIAWYLNGSRGGELKDAALVAFVAPNEEDWRFSLVKMDYRFEESKNGRMRVKEEFTPARRWSFLVGVNENSHTAQSQLVDLVADDERNPALAQLEEAFNIEKVTREFFEKYRELFLRTKEKLDDTVKKDKKIREDFESKGVDTVDFSKKLLGQIVFLYFLQKKGWFGVKRDAGWGTGPKNFLRELFEGRVILYKNFFNDVLEPLFYDALALDRSHIDHWNDHFQCKLPFLNGGLFDPINNYSWEKTVMDLPNGLFSNDGKDLKTGDIGDGILDIFDRYNFTVKEDEPLEKEVAVDPEMLGKVFENLLEVKDRKSKGTYYTPREIVHYMCQQSLINYLFTECNLPSPLPPKASLAPKDGMGEGKGEGVILNEVKNPILTKEDIELLVKYGETLVEYEAIYVEKMSENFEYKGKYDSPKLPKSIENNAGLIDEKLAEIKVCDPAIGSGAFPVGMMSEIVKARNVLSAYLSLREAEATNQSRSIYNFKRECIEKSLYGVDIDAGAVEIAKLRLWLSLVVDEEDIKQIKPLPNLDYKIVCGNSLLGYPYEPHGLKEIEELEDQLFYEIRPSEKRRLQEAINTKIRNLLKNTKQSLGYEVNFDFKIFFPRVFREKGGFDVAIANPPYIFARESKAKGLNKELKTQLYRNYSLARYQINSYPLFIELGNNILGNKGTLSFIVPNNWMTINTNKELRKFILEKSDVVLVNFYARVFETANVDSSVIIYRKSGSNKIITLYEYETDFRMIKRCETKYFLGQRDYIINIQILKNNKVADFIIKIENKSQMLRDVSTVKAGLMAYETGKGEPPQSEKMKDNRVYHSRIKIDETYFKYLDGQDVCRYLINWSGEYLKYGDNLAAPRINFALFSSPRILVRQIPSKPPYCINACFTDEIFLNDRNSMNVINIKISPQYVLAILNSKLTSFWFVYKFGKMQRGIFPQFKVNELERFPIPQISEGRQKSFIILVDKILAITKGDDYLQNSTKQAKIKEYERQIDQMVYQLYGLTEDEIKIIEQFGAKDK